MRQKNPIKKEGKVRATRARGARGSKPVPAHARADALLRLDPEKRPQLSTREMQSLLRALKERQLELEQRAEALNARVREVTLLGEAISRLGEGVMITDDELNWPGPRICFVNEAMCRISGYSAKELVGKTPRILQGGETNRATIKQIRAQLAASDSCQAELINRRKDGSTYHAEVLIHALYDPNGQRSHFVSIHRDISKQKKAEKALRYEHEFRRKIIETAQIIILVLDNEGRVLQYNKYFEDLSGWRIDETEGADWFDIFLPPRDRERIRDLFSRAIGGMHTRGYVNPIVTKDGRERAIEWFDALLTDDTNATVGLLCTGVDITERQLLEQEVINAAEEERVRTAQELHDGLGSLLTGVDYRARALANQCLAERSNWANDAEIISQLVREAINQVKAISKGLHPVSSDPAGLMNALKLLVVQARGTPGIRCQFRCGKAVFIDDRTAANHLFRIAQEALNNAVKYSGGGRITVSLAPKADELVLKVMDNGIGFDPDCAGFDGLGLHVMRYRTRAMNGSLVIRRRKSRGMEVRCSVSASLLTAESA